MSRTVSHVSHIDESCRVRISHVTSMPESRPVYNRPYGVATISRLLKIIGLFCKRAIYTRQYSAKEPCNLKEPTNQSHPILARRCRQPHKSFPSHTLQRQSASEQCHPYARVFPRVNELCHTYARVMSHV